MVEVQPEHERLLRHFPDLRADLFRLFSDLFEAHDLRYARAGEHLCVRHLDLERDRLFEVHRFELFELVGKEHHLEVAVEVHQVDDAELVAFFGDLFRDLFDFADKDGERAVGDVLKVRRKRIV